MLTTTQDEIITGLMLGDGSIEMHKGCINARLLITRSRIDEKYIDEHVAIFSNLFAKKVNGEVFDKRTLKTYKFSKLATLVSSLLNEYHNKWYKNNVKTIPLDIKITPLVLATWFADDGSFSIRKGFFAAKLATHSFSKDEVLFLRNQLFDTFNLNFRIYQENSGKKICWFLSVVNKSEVRKLTEIIDPVFPCSMERKSNKWRFNRDLLKEKQYPNCKFCNSNNIYKNGHNKNKQTYLCKDCRRQFTAPTF